MNELELSDLHDKFFVTAISNKVQDILGDRWRPERPQNLISREMEISGTKSEMWMACQDIAHDVQTELIEKEMYAMDFSIHLLEYSFETMRIKIIFVCVS